MRVLAPLREHLEGRFRQLNFLGIPISRDDSHDKFIAVPVVGCTVAVGAEGDWFGLGQ